MSGKRNMKKGFTLIELLAVIVVLAIVSLITIPTIVNLINTSKKGAAVDSAYGLDKAATLYHVSNMAKMEEDAIFNCTGSECVLTSDNNVKLEIEGTIPSKGVVYVRKNGKVETSGLVINGYNCVKTEGKFNCDTDKTLLKDLDFYKDSNLNGADPEIYTGLIPVTIENNGTVKIADQTKAWYSYNDKRWANAVTVNDESYRNAGPGTIIPESAISIYYVWIPRYRYLLFNANNGSIPAQRINLIFESKDTAKSNGTVNGEFLTHPAFTFGDVELNGIWVSKFEATGSLTELTSKPNLTPVANQSIAAMFISTRNMEKENNNYGFISETGSLNSDFTYTTNDNEIDSHMLKNMEWGAITYLTHSQYGRCNDSVCTDVGFNDYYVGQESKTGCSNTIIAKNTVCNPYTNALGSTTGNIYGIYDMSGGAWEYVMSNMSDESGDFIIGESGFETIPNGKYYDSYAYDDSEVTHLRGFLGDATREILARYGNKIGSWYSSGTILSYGEKAWLKRGGGVYNIYSAPSTSGMFCFYHSSGTIRTYNSFRLALIKDIN